MRIFVFALYLLLSMPAQAQTLTSDFVDISEGAPQEKTSSPPATASSGLPLEITADNSLEWQRNDKTFTARGNALAKQGDTSIKAATLTAHYSDKDGGGMKISQVHAKDGVVIHSKDMEAFGAAATYDLDKGYAIMTGDDLRIVSPDQVVTAHEKFEYWTVEGKFSAIGGAKVTRGTDTLEADKVSAVMKNDSKGKRVLDRLEAEGNVVITTPTENVTGQKGVYTASTNMAQLSGGVKITRGPNVLEGEHAEVDLTTNTSRIFGSKADGGRVKGIFYPGTQKTP
jgi:lipopolysaccharide export system protein LptA